MVGKKLTTVDDMIQFLEPFRGFKLSLRDMVADEQKGIVIKRFELETHDIGYSDRIVVLGMEEVER